MKRLILNRLLPDDLPMVPIEQFNNRTLGVMQVGTNPINVIERAWIPNPAADVTGVDAGKPFESCVPVGEYDLVQRYSPSKEGTYWHLVNEDLGVYLTRQGCPDIDPETREPKRSRYSCMFHVANYWYDIVGCCGPGQYIADFGSTHDRGYGVASSGNTLDLINGYLEGEASARLVIR